MATFINHKLKGSEFTEILTLRSPAREDEVNTTEGAGSGSQLGLEVGGNYSASRTGEHFQ